jgi:TetR/AcrR family hemagglutinin/protease transcriptional regulator
MVNKCGYAAAMLSPGKPVRTRLAPDDRRAQLLAHAVSACADHGIARVTQAQVAQRAGVSVSAVYSYFRTRADLVGAVLDTVAATIVTMVAAETARPGPAVAVLTQLATSTAAMAVEAPDTVRVWLDWSTGVRADVWPQFLVLQARLHDLVEAVLRQGAPGDPATRSAARLFVGGAHTLALMRFEQVGDAELALFIDQMVAGAVAACP